MMYCGKVEVVKTLSGSESSVFSRQAKALDSSSTSTSVNAAVFKHSHGIFVSSIEHEDTSLISVNHHRLQTLEGSYCDVGGIGVQFFCCVFFVVSFTLESDSYSVRNGLDALSPECLVEFGVKSNVLCSHFLLCECDDGFYSPWSTFLEGTTMNALVKMDGVLAGDNILQS